MNRRREGLRGWFYFSHGERQATAVLLSLVAAAWLTVTFLPAPPASPPSPPLVTTPVNKTPEGCVTGGRPFYEERYPRREKFSWGTVVELNAADTVTLQKVPGIGSAFSRRIVKYRRLLGGYASVTQLAEVYGIDEERYEALKDWFRVDTTLIRRLPVNTLPVDSLGRHPYLSFRQARLLKQCAHRLGRPLAGWHDVDAFPSLNEFPPADRLRLAPYLSFFP
jgi:hypothetical protein